MNSGIDAGRTREFMELYSLHQRQLYYYLVTLCASGDDADEVLAATNLAAWENFEQFQPGTNFLAWIRQIAWHRVIAHRREQGRFLTALQPDVLEQVAARYAEGEALDDALHRELLGRCLAKLTRADRELVAQRYMLGATIKSLAESLRRSPNALSKALGRIRARLYDCLRAATAAAERELHS
jgi:RNA polymerase sigma-70 factor (ECF subfamily)